MNTKFDVDLGESNLYRTIRKKDRIGIGFDAKMAGMESREEVSKYLESLMEEWEKANPHMTPTEVVDEIRGQSCLITGGRAYHGYRFFKPVKK